MLWFQWSMIHKKNRLTARASFDRPKRKVPLARMNLIWIGTITTYRFRKKTLLTVNFSMILIAPCICKPSNVMKDVSAWKRLCQSVARPGGEIARESRKRDLRQIDRPRDESSVVAPSLTLYMFMRFGLCDASSNIA